MMLLEPIQVQDTGYQLVHWFFAYLSGRAKVFGIVDDRVHDPAQEITAEMIVDEHGFAARMSGSELRQIAQSTDVKNYIREARE